MPRISDLQVVFVEDFVTPAGQKVVGQEVAPGVTNLAVLVAGIPVEHLTDEARQTDVLHSVAAQFMVNNGFVFAPALVQVAAEKGGVAGIEFLAKLLAEFGIVIELGKEDENGGIKATIEVVK